MMDKDGDGFLTTSDLEESGVDKEIIEEMIKELDADGDGRISYARMLQCLFFKKATKFDKIYHFLKSTYLIKLILFIF